MATSPIPRRVAVDTGALLALASTRDQYHDRAQRTLARLQQSGTRFVGHVLVLGELHGHLIRRIPPPEARRLVHGVLNDSLFEWRDVSPGLMGLAIANWIERFHEQRFSLTDAVTFETMKQERIAQAFAFDTDFTTAGFTLLP